MKEALSPRKQRKTHFDFEPLAVQSSLDELRAKPDSIAELSRHAMAAPGLPPVTVTETEDTSQAMSLPERDPLQDDSEDDKGGNAEKEREHRVTDTDEDGERMQRPKPEHRRKSLRVAMIKLAGGGQSPRGTDLPRFFKSKPLREQVRFVQHATRLPSDSKDRAADRDDFRRGVSFAVPSSG
jgi:hypothetical protein